MYSNETAEVPFYDFGAPAQVTAGFSRAAGVDKNGNPVLFQGRGQAPDPFFMLMTRIDTGETKQFSAESCESNYPWGMCVTKAGKVYIGSCCDGTMYEFDVQSEKLHLLGRPSPTETYIWVLTEGPDGIIYGGTYGNCRLVGYDPKKKKLLDLARLDPTEQYVRAIEATEDGFIYTGIGTSKADLCAYEIATGKVFHLINESDRGPGTGHVEKDSNGKCYGVCPTKSGVKYYRIEGPKAFEIEKSEMPPRRPIQFEDHSELDHIDENTQTLHFRTPGQDSERNVHFTQHASGTTLFCLVAGPDKKIYISSILPLYLSSLDPETGKSKLYGRVDGAEVYSFLNHKGKLWMAAYPGGILSCYDPSKPWNPARDSSGNPRMLPGDNTYIHRPFKMIEAPDQEMILIGGIPDYGMVGGSLVVFNPDTCKKEAEYRNIIESHSIKGLCLTADGMVCGGSSTEGGGGAHILQNDAEIFLWDYKTRKKVFSIVAVPGTQSVSDLILGPDKMIYGLADQYIFVFDPVKREIIHVEESIYGQPAFNALTLSPKGNVLALLGSDVVEILPETYETKSIAHYSEQITAGVVIVGGSMYFGCKSHLIGFKLPENV